uniref:30S ribosomal protein S19 n=1 Tax=Amorphochlora amoebiformis TaxID=1561963 RepID=A0A7S0DVR3_9EUKA|mmetsp:Transcript_8739/g.13746  ORF Transcript_8739/g.13746 Transcript_8739/m.13746 type:complete len:130 (+) Transcript_8739:39-428(+)
MLRAAAAPAWRSFRPLGSRGFARSRWKGPFFDIELLMAARDKQEELRELRRQGKSVQQRKPIETTCRSTTIIPEFIGLKFAVHNGKEYKTVMITDDMVGHKLGEFSPTRRRAKHPVKVIDPTQVGGPKR